MGLPIRAKTHFAPSSHLKHLRQFRKKMPLLRILYCDLPETFANNANFGGTEGTAPPRVVQCTVCTIMSGLGNGVRSLVILFTSLSPPLFSLSFPHRARDQGAISDQGGRGKEGQRQRKRKDSVRGSRGNRQDLLRLSETETKSPGRSPCERQVCSKMLRLQSCAEGAKPLYLGSSSGQRHSSHNLVMPMPCFASHPDKKYARQASVFSEDSNSPSRYYSAKHWG